MIEISYYLREFVGRVQTGRVLGGEGGMMISREPDTWRAFDVAYISHEQVSRTGVSDGYWEVAPELVVEVISPANRADEIRTKINECLSAGVQMVWIIYPKHRLIDVYRPDQPIITLKRGDTLTGGDVLSEFALSLDKLFSVLP